MQSSLFLPPLRSPLAPSLSLSLSLPPSTYFPPSLSLFSLPPSLPSLFLALSLSLSFSLSLSLSLSLSPSFSLSLPLSFFQSLFFTSDLIFAAPLPVEQAPAAYFVPNDQLGTSIRRLLQGFTIRDNGCSALVFPRHKQVSANK